VRHVVATIVALAGTAMVFGLILLMNDSSETFDEDQERTAVAMEVAPKPKPPKRKPKPKPKPKPSTPRPSAPPPPVPSAGSGLASVSLGMPSADVDVGAETAGKLLGDVKTSVMTEDAVDSRPKPTRRKAASYPPRARAKGITGSVKMSLLISDRGTVERIKVLRAEPPGIFEEAAKTAVREWQFEPATYQGEPVKVWATQTVRFELK
jgi:protein TonB